VSDPRAADVREPGEGEAERAPWDLGPIVAGLRDARGAERCGLELPSRERVAAIVAGLRAALFPGHFGTPGLAGEAVDYFVGHTLDETLRALREQVRRSLACQARPEGPRAASDEITRGLASRLPEIRALLESDVRAAFAGDPAARSVDEVLLCYPGVTAITHHRLAHALYGLGAPLLARIVSELSHAATGIDLHPGATIGPSFFIDHGTGVVIGETASIGERVRIYQGVTLGAKSFPTTDDGALAKGLARHPLVEDDVVIYAGATILGRITIGRGSSIGGNVWLTRSVPPGSRVTQLQAKSELFDGGAGI
jgi:serine O-acetyltransferase